MKKNQRRFNQARFKKTILPSGLTLVTETCPEHRSLSVGIWVKTGTRHELQKEVGISHFLEHMLFKGTEKRTPLDIVREVDQVGGEFNAFTTREYTCFHILLLKQNLDLAIDILSDVLLNSTFESVELERERKVILQEIAMVDEAPEELAHDLFFELAFPKHGLGRPILGTERSVRGMTRANLLKFFRHHYRPDQIVISVAGAVSHQEVRKRLKSLLRASWPGRPAPRKRGAKHPGRFELGPDSAPHVQSGKWWVKRDTEQVHLVWGVKGTPYRSPDRFAAYLLNLYLGGGMSSSLFQEIREKSGLAYTVYSSLTPFLDTGLFTIYAATGMNQVPLCLKLIEECVGKLKRELLTHEELRMIQENLKGTIQLSSDDVESRMTSIARNEMYFGQFYGVDEVCEMIDAVKPEDIRRVARKLLSSGERSILALGPSPSPAVRRKLGAWKRINR